MRVFVAGATGVVGRRAVARMVAAGHDVSGIARSPEKAAQLESLGATGVEVSLFDADALRAAVAGHDAVVNLTTHIPSPGHMARMSAWDENERIRREGSTNLVDAAIAAGARVFVQESLAFLYGDHGDRWIDATNTKPLDGFPSEATQIAEANVARFTAQGGRGVVLRFGLFYAPDSEQTRAIVKTARNGLALDLGPPGAYSASIAADDAGSAAAAALEAPAGVYDIVDNEPMTRAEQGAVLARAVGRRRLWRGPQWTTPKRASFLGASQRVSNQRFRDATSWKPSRPSLQEGYPALVRELNIEPALGGWTRLMLWILAFSAFGVGMQAAFFPRSFYDDFPFGRGWVAMDGLYNEHLIRDVGELNLALLVVTIGALVISTRAVARVAALAWLVYSVPHWVYHLRHLTMNMSGADKIGVMTSLAVPIIAAVVILFTARRAPDPARTAASAVPSGGEARSLHVSRA